MKPNLEIWRNAKLDTELFSGYMKFMGIEPAEYEGVGLRLHPDLRCDEKKTKFPAMVACLITPDSQLAAIHCTYIMDAWETLRHTTEFEAPAIGSSVHLFSTQSSTALIVATAIETALATRAIIYRRTGNLVPCWATLDTQTMKYLVVPEEIRYIKVAVDNDVDFTSQSAGYQLANRLMLVEGRKVSVMTPDRQASNFNDELRHVDEVTAREDSE